MHTNHSNSLPVDAPSPNRRTFSPKTAACTAIWIAAVFALTGWMIRDANKPGLIGPPPMEWPVESNIHRSTTQPTLIVFAHPKCPCTRASLGELALLLTEHHQKLSAHVVFLKPEGTAEDWTATDLWHQAKEIPGVTVSIDAAGQEAHRFNAETSGQTLLYDQNGHLAFCGGITLSRGHAGENPGRSAITEYLELRSSKASKNPVFGCALFENVCSRQETVSQP